MFADRQYELAFLDDLPARAQLGSAQLCAVTGRRRVGKTALLLHWAEQSGLPYIYWPAVKEPAIRQRTRLAARLLDVLPENAPAYRSWGELWEAVGRAVPRSCRILILDNLPYAIEADAEMLPALRAAWERYLRSSQTTVILCGTYGRVMEQALSDGSPLREQITASLHLRPLPFSAMHEIFPAWDADARVLAYAISGGVPAYLVWLDPAISPAENFRQVILRTGSLFMEEPNILLYDELREPNNYLGIMKAISAGAHTLTEISAWTAIPVTSVTFYLTVLQDLHLVERRLPVTVEPSGRGRAKNGRYFVADAYFRFFLRFLEPLLSESPWTEKQAVDSFINGITDFAGSYTFPELAGQWLQAQSDAGRLPFKLEAVDGFWNDRIQMSVVGINRSNREILLTECKWRPDPVEPLEVRALTEAKTRRVLRDLPDEGEGWQVYYAFFARKGFLPAAYGQLQRFGGLAVNLNSLDAVLGQNKNGPSASI